ncbi:hypothetical protein V2J09_011884 [Rumex salicifolius]
MEPIRSFSRQRIPSSSDRFLTLFSQSPPSASASSAFATSSGDELSEDDVLWNGELAGSPKFLSSSSPSISRTPPANKNHRLASSKSIGRAEKFGILSALPEIEQDRNKIRSIFDHKKSSVTSSSCSAMMIPVIPRPTLERTLSASFRHHQYQSVPVNVPLRMRDDLERPREGRLLEESDLLEEEDEEAEMLPPHEIKAKQAMKAPILSCSVLEGAGRTLKGRDLRQMPKTSSNEPQRTEEQGTSSQFVVKDKIG